ncbi:hypothetical protein ACFV1L_31880 [Kitasatospora sp. NPDC059646]|uniref:hypothetical protein n=1 Tax=Kitasatospora sp. NPDC059646 TaxID=3346893 RepID=UPI0036843D6F
MLQEGDSFRELTDRETVDCRRAFTSGARPTAEVLARTGLEPRAGTRSAGRPTASATGLTWHRC